MKILFAFQHPGFVRHFEGSICELAGRGHEVVLAFSNWGPDKTAVLPMRLQERFPNVRVIAIPGSTSPWLSTARAIRSAQDYLRYFTPAYENSPFLRRRIVGKGIPPAVARRVEWLIDKTSNSPAAIDRYEKLLARAEASIPVEKATYAFLRKQAPDVVVISPVVIWGGEQVEIIKAARQRRIPTVVGIASWDNLTNKGLIRLCPERVLVWNEAQKREAVEMHGIPAERVGITGAQTFDKWVGRAAKRKRATFCLRVGLAPESRYLLYLGSSKSIASDHEPAFVRRWIEAIRSSSDPTISSLSILIRPHPQNASSWRDFDVTQMRDVAIYPREGAIPSSSETEADFFDSLAHSEAVVGINTSAQLEAAIVGKPVLTIEDPAFERGQGGTLHYRHLVDQGLLTVAHDLDEHIRQLGALVADPDSVQANLRKFVSSFIRPLGMDVAGGVAFADEVEKTAAAGATLPPVRPSSAIRLALRTIRSRLPKESRPTPKITNEAIKLATAESKSRRSIDGSPDLAGLDLEKTLGELRGVMRGLARHDNPIIVGPWTSEVGFELLYWIPFLKWCISRHKIDPKRVIAVSRGGVGSWYDGIAEQYQDIYEIEGLDRFREVLLNRRDTTGSLKHWSVTEHDHLRIEAIKEKLDLQHAALLHPSLMYKLFVPFWRGMWPARSFHRHVNFEPFTPLPRSEATAWLPERYISARFYFRPSFPDTPENRAFVREIVDRMRQKMPVVLLDSGIIFDDHEDFTPSESEGVYTLRGRTHPETNLALQSEIISNSQTFIGTYGGLSYLAPLYGISALAISSDMRGFQPAHLGIAYTAFRTLGRDFNHISTDQLRLLMDVFDVPDALLEAGAERKLSSLSP